jgi:16S rRNA (guanine527-N7)-methyltransferase
MRADERQHIAGILRAGIGALGIAMGEKPQTQLLDYLELMIKWNGVYNLTAVRDPAQMVVQHILDSLAAVPAFRNADNVLDVGAGGGLPGIVLAIWAAEAEPAMRITLIDTVQKKTAFLTQVKAELKLANVTVITGRVENLQVEWQFDVITSRAFAELADFVNWSGHLLAEQGRFIAMKGIMPTEEIQRLPAGWRVQRTEQLTVPGMSAERHLIFIQRDTEHA